MTADPHDSRELAKACARIADVLDHLEAARYVETRIVEWELLGICDEVLYPRHICVERACVSNVVPVEIACDQMARAHAELAVDIAFAAPDIDHTLDPGSASDAIQGPQNPALPSAVSRQEKLIVHPLFTFYYEKLYH